MPSCDGAAKGRPPDKGVPAGTVVCAAACRDGGEGAVLEVLERRLHELGRGEHRVNYTGPAPDHSRALARDIPGKTHARREVLVIGLPESIANRRLTLLNHSERRIEVAQEVVVLFDRRYVGVAQAQIDDQFRGDAPVILNEPRDDSARSGRGPLCPRVEILSTAVPAKKSSKAVRTDTVSERRHLPPLEIDPAPRVVEVEIGLDVRVLDAELEGVLARQIRDTVLKIVIRVGELDWDGHANLPRGRKTSDGDSRKPTHTRDARVEGVVLCHWRTWCRRRETGRS